MGARDGPCSTHRPVAGVDNIGRTAGKWVGTWDRIGKRKAGVPVPEQVSRGATYGRKSFRTAVPWLHRVEADPLPSPEFTPPPLSLLYRLVVLVINPTDSHSDSRNDDSITLPASDKEVCLC